MRTVWYAFCLAAVAICAMVGLGISAVPYRGPRAQLADAVILSLLVAVFLLLLAAVLDAGRIVRSWLKCAEDVAKTGFAVVVVKTGFAVNAGLKPFDLKELVEQAGEVTGDARARIIRPFIIAALMLVARTPVFDNWVMVPGLACVFVLNIGLLFGCWFSIKKAADKLKHEVVDVLNDRLSRNPSDTQAEDALSHIEACRAGAYGPLFANPILDGMLIVLTGGSVQAVFPGLLDRFLG